MNIRLGTLADKEAVLALYRACAAKIDSCWTEEYPNEEFLCIDIDNRWLYVAQNDIEIVGTVSLMPTDDIEDIGLPFSGSENVCVLTRLCVSPELQGHGNGAALLALAEYQACQNDARWMHLLCDQLNRKAMALYLRSGYTEVGRPTLYGCDFIAYEKRLTL